MGNDSGSPMFALLGRHHSVDVDVVHAVEDFLAAGYTPSYLDVAGTNGCGCGWRRGLDTRREPLKNICCMQPGPSMVAIDFFNFFLSPNPHLFFSPVLIAVDGNLACIKYILRLLCFQGRQMTEAVCELGPEILAASIADGASSDDSDDDPDASLPGGAGGAAVEGIVSSCLAETYVTVMHVLNHGFRPSSAHRGDEVYPGEADEAPAAAGVDIHGGDSRLLSVAARARFVTYLWFMDRLPPELAMRVVALGFGGAAVTAREDLIKFYSELFV